MQKLTFWFLGYLVWSCFFLFCFSFMKIPLLHRFNGQYCCCNAVVVFLRQIQIFSFANSVLAPAAWDSRPVWHKQCHISDPSVLSRITRREWSGDVQGPVWGADRRIVSQPVPYPQTGRCPLSLRGRLLTRGEPGGCRNEETWELLRGWAGHLMSSTRAGCDAEWAEGERQSAVCYKGLVWRVGREEKILSTSKPLHMQKIHMDSTWEKICVLNYFHEITMLNCDFYLILEKVETVFALFQPKITTKTQK